jgi:CRP-like cAMP-binding protein
MLRAQYSEALSRDRWFSSLPERLAEGMLSIAVRRTFEAGQRICLRGQRHTGLYSLVEGVIHLLNHLQADSDSFLGSFEPPMWLGEMEFFDDSQVSHDAYAHAPCVLLFLSRDRLLELLGEEPALWGYLGKLQAMKLRLAYFMIDEFSGMSTEIRLARRLLAKAAGHGMRTGFQPTLGVRQELLAQSLGLVRASVTPILQEWRRRGIVQLGYRSIALTDPAELMKIARYCEWPAFYKKHFDLPVALADDF